MLFHVLGPLEVHTTIPCRPGAGKPAAVLAALLLRPDAWVGVDRLVEAVWPGRAAPASAEANLRTYVWQLRRMLPDHQDGPRIERTADAYRIRVGPGELDAQRAAELGAAARSARGTEALGLLHEALGLWRGRPFEGVEVEPEPVAQLEQLHLDLREHLGEVQLTLGRGPDAIATLRSVVADAPLRETAWTLLVRAQHTSGLRTEALVAYREAAEVFRAELGIEPGPALTAAHRLALGSTRRELPRDVHLIGRDTELARLEEPAPVVIVDGMPGVGKTALVVHAAHRLVPGFPDGQLFVSLGGSEPVAQRLLRAVGSTDVPSDPEEQAALWRSEVARRRLLIVLDGARDAAQVRPLLPATPGSRMLITTAHRGWHLDGAVRIRLQPLGEEDATALFASAAATRTLDRRVLHGCGGLPAALLDAAARLLTRPYWTPQRLADELAEDPCQVFSGAVRQSVGAALAGLSVTEQSAWRALGSAPAEFGAEPGTRAAYESLVDKGLLDSTGPDRYRSHPVLRHLAACRPARTPRHRLLALATPPIGGPL
ncbi:AfsR/SARP family transcriptional regulator [Actinoplanes friuliensis]|uniref:SARP family transcriptional regulator n=1 Tax=Actinoplanes friuliensis DSM 7358 TaxID=1246995 RepID=U5W7H7_9ACTN|nr:BTAD domain-containing putative transcriptional regulator [Actinoplanes friuliensis]AGZ43906.1 SARP family transcriptional regulator [Actinoplanes friuliensis DSM 7358]